MSLDPDLRKNPLVNPPKTKNGVPAFDRIKVEHILPAMDWAIAEARKNIDAIKAQKHPTFANAVEALEKAARSLARIHDYYENMEIAHRTDELDQISDAVSDKLSAFYNDIHLDRDLYRQIRKVADDQQARAALAPDQQLLIDDTIKGFLRNGVELSDADKQKLRDIDAELGRQTKLFGRNLLKSDNAIEILLSKPSQIKGLPPRVVKIAADLAKEKGHDGKWLFTVEQPGIGPLLNYADDREVRKKAWWALARQGTEKATDNRPVVKRILELRHQRVQLLAKHPSMRALKTHADYVLQDRMARNQSNVVKLLKYLADKAKKAAEKEAADLQKFAVDSGFPLVLRPWDIGYYANKKKQADFGFDPEELRPYFKFEDVAKGAFETAEKLYGIKLTKATGYPTYAGDVDVFEVHDKKSGELVGVLYTDYYPRKTKSGGAWESSYRRAYTDENGQRVVPIVGVHGNFDKPAKGKDMLLPFHHVETFFHEFGHSLHDLLSRARYESQSGTNVKWDFVELPSQIMENWARDPQVLKTFARHHETGAPIPEKLLEKMQKAGRYRAASATMQQVLYATLDLALHATDPKRIGDLEAFESRVVSPLMTRQREDGEMLATSLSHLFSGGYDAGYYSYKWAEVLDADAFEVFTERGVFDPKTAAAFKKLLEAGGSVDPEKLFEDFAGHKPDPDALLRRDGLLPPKKAQSKLAANTNQKPQKKSKRNSTTALRRNRLTPG